MKDFFGDLIDPILPDDLLNNHVRSHTETAASLGSCIKFRDILIREVGQILLGRKHLSFLIRTDFTDRYSYRNIKFLCCIIFPSCLVLYISSPADRDLPGYIRYIELSLKIHLLTSQN